MRRLLTLSVLAVAFFIAEFSQAVAAKRVALVIGNDAYKQVTRLRKAVNDARTIGETLEGIGFKVLRAVNLTRRAMNRQLQLFASQIETGDEALFFFAGHGVEINGRNYLLPTDIPSAKPGQEDFVKTEAIPVDQVLDRIRSRGARVSILVLDACRDNPFPTTGTRSLGGSRGLARMPAPEGTFIMYSAGVGQTALDRLSDNEANPNSVFTRSLVPLLKRPGLSLTTTARQVRRDVQKLARTVSHDQRPAYYDEVTGEFFFAGPGDARNVTTPQQPSSRLSPAAQAWSLIKDTKAAGDLEAFINEYPDSFYAKLAKARLDKLKEKKVAVGVFPEKQKSPPKRTLKPGDEFQECDVCPKMVVVPAGSFTMGSPKSEKGRDDDEGPPRQVRIAQPFAVAKFEVTFAEWNECVSAGGCKYRPTDLGWGRGRRPVIGVSWDDAKVYVAWLSRKTGREYRLLSEAEWEYAARGGTTTRYHFGNSESDLCGYANAADRSTSIKWKNMNCSDGVGKKTAEVGRYRANNFGLHDMHGNLSEWVEDCYSKTYGGAPADGSARTSGSCRQRVLRGGSWLSEPRQLRSASRDWLHPDIRFDTLGFRVARTLTSEELK